MALYAIGRRSTAVLINQAMLTVYTGAGARALVLEVGVTNGAGAVDIGIGRPAVAGITPTSPVLLLAEDPASPASSVNSALAWATHPTSPGTFFRRWNGPSTVGTGVVWTFPRGIAVPVSTNFVIFNIAASAAADAYIVVDE